MKRYGNLWEKIIDENNIRLAYNKAKKCKPRLRGVIKFKQDVEGNLKRVRELLVTKTFKTSRYFEKQVFEPKKRIIYVLPFFPDRIVQHAVLNVLIPIWEKLFIKDSYACIEGRGIHKGSSRTMEFVRKYKYCLKCDVSQYYPSIKHDILKKIIRRKIKCPDTLWLLDDIIDSFPGGSNVPIGNFTSQWFGNLYLNELDTFIKHELKLGGGTSDTAMTSSSLITVKKNYTEQRQL